MQQTGRWRRQGDERAHLRHRAAEAGRDGSGGAECARRRRPIWGFGRKQSRSLRKYWLAGASDAEVKALGERLLANDAIEQVYFGPLALERLELGRPYRFELRTIAIRELDDDGAHAAEPRGAALSATGRDADDSAAFSRLGARSDGRRTGDDRPNVERALQPQDAGRPDCVSR